MPMPSLALNRQDSPDSGINGKAKTQKHHLSVQLSQLKPLLFLLFMNFLLILQFQVQWLTAVLLSLLLFSVDAQHSPVPLSADQQQSSYCSVGNSSAPPPTSSPSCPISPTLPPVPTQPPAPHSAPKLPETKRKTLRT